MSSWWFKRPPVWAQALAGLGIAGSLFGMGRFLRQMRWCPRNGTRVALVGDSLAVGLAKRLGDRASGCGTPFMAAVEGATRTQQWTGDRLDHALDWKPTMLLVSLGGNDYAHSKPETVEAAAELIITRARAAGAVVLWIHPPPMPHADKAGAADIWESLVRCTFPTDRVYFPQGADKIHPTPSGYNLLGDAIWNWLGWLSWHHQVCGGRR